MKDMDFIPQWYKAGRERKRRYVRQYTLMAIVFSLMTVWGFLVDSHISRVQADVEEMQASYERTQLRSDEAVLLIDEISQMNKKSNLLQTITPRTKVTAILGELSFLIEKNIILSRLSLLNEPIQDPASKSSKTSRAVIQVNTAQRGKENDVVTLAPSHCKVVLKGVAASHADAARLIAQLEQTSYFDGVFLAYSKPKKLKDRDVTEFEIRCIVADYQQLK